MKRKITALFLLIVTLFASSHATLAFHYCGGNLHSVNVGSGKISCCENKKHSEACQEENTIRNIPCCSNRYLEINTDDFHITQNITVGNGNDFHLVAFDFYPVFGLENTVATQTFPFVFPPGGFAPSGINLLLSICILRI